MKTTKLEITYEKFANYFQGNFQNAIWQLIINENRKDRESAFVPVIHQHGYMLGIADKNQPGYSDIGVYFIKKLKWKEAQEITEQLNEIVFELDVLQAAQIQMTTFKSTK